MEQHPEVAQSLWTISCTAQLLFTSDHVVYVCVYFYVRTTNAMVTHLIKEQKETVMTMNTCISILNSNNMYGIGLVDQLIVNVMSLYM